MFYTSNEQQQQAKQLIKKLGDNIVTEVSVLDVFYPAEDYHQNYYNNNPNQPYCAMLITPKLDKYFK